MFDPSQIEEYRAVKAPDDLKVRLEQADTSTPRPVLRRVIPWVAAAAACLVLTIAGFAMSRAPSVQITASSSFALARSSTAEVLPIVELTLSADSGFTLEAADPSITLPGGATLELPCSAQNTLTLWWEIEASSVTVTIDGHTYTLHADPTTFDVTVS